MKSLFEIISKYSLSDASDYEYDRYRFYNPSIILLKRPNFSFKGMTYNVLNHVKFSKAYKALRKLSLETGEKIVADGFVIEGSLLFYDAMFEKILFINGEPRNDLSSGAYSRSQDPSRYRKRQFTKIPLKPFDNSKFPNEQWQTHLVKKFGDMSFLNVSDVYFTRNDTELLEKSCLDWVSKKKRISKYAASKYLMYEQLNYPNTLQPPWAKDGYIYIRTKQLKSAIKSAKAKKKAEV